MRRNYGETETTSRSPLDEASATTVLLLLCVGSIVGSKHPSNRRTRHLLHYEVDHEVVDREGACGYP